MPLSFRIPRSRHRWGITFPIQFVLSHIPFAEQTDHWMQWVNRNTSERKMRLKWDFPQLCTSLLALNKLANIEGAIILEVGTGCAPLPTFLFHLMGAKRIFSYDHQRHLRFDLVREILQVFEKERHQLAVSLGLPQASIDEKLARLRQATDLPGLLRKANIRYVAPGDASDTGFRGTSIDIVFSHAVLEHVPESSLTPLLKESRRVLKERGCFYALIGLHDHYSCFDGSISKVNFLKHPEWLWRLFVKNRISYHNRLRGRKCVDLLESNGFAIKSLLSTVDAEDIERVRSMRVDQRFSRFSPEECAVTFTEIFAVPKPLQDESSPLGIG